MGSAESRSHIPGVGDGVKSFVRPQADVQIAENTHMRSILFPPSPLPLPCRFSRATAAFFRRSYIRLSAAFVPGENSHGRLFKLFLESGIWYTPRRAVRLFLFPSASRKLTVKNRHRETGTTVRETRRGKTSKRPREKFFRFRIIVECQAGIGLSTR